MTPEERKQCDHQVTPSSKTWKKVPKSDAAHYAMAETKSGNEGVGNVTMFQETICD
jgi:hypothetical protein